MNVLFMELVIMDSNSGLDSDMCNIFVCRKK